MGNQKYVDSFLNRKFGRLLVVSEVDSVIDSDGKKRTMLLCRCDCGKEVVVRATLLKRGITKSCGCIHNEQLTNRSIKHGKAKTRLYRIWCGMKSRCNNPNSSAYHNYGARGISVCDCWNSDFLTFQKWALTNGYSNDKTLDRINNNGNYTPENCKWATYTEQANNKRNNRILCFNNELHTVAQWSKITGIPVGVIEDRINKLGWTVEESLTVPVDRESERTHKQNQRRVHNGRNTKSLSEAG